MNAYSIDFTPLFDWWLIAIFAAITVLPVFWAIWRGVPGGLLRGVVLGLLVLALANPSILEEEREPLKSVVTLIVDRSDSQKLDGRDGQTDAVVSALESQLSGMEQFEVRQIDVANDRRAESDASTALFAARENALRDVPPDQLGGTIFITDGQVHDVPEAFSSPAPVHTLLTGSQDDRDRRIVISKAPRFGIVGETQEIVFAVEDTNIGTGGLVNVRVLIDGEPYSVEQVTVGEPQSLVFEVPHGGKIVVELEVDAVDGEITTSNNRTYSVMKGIRENLRVLLVSGEPHAGERTWRNLLKSDASVDLVHFTILRPPEKQDGTPINQLSLIAFPTRELFIEKLDEFDLIIFDRYTRRGLLPVLYFDNIARYVEEGGAVLVAAGPEHADLTSIHRTALARVLPFEPSGSVTTDPYKPQLSDAGRRHPVTRRLTDAAGADIEDPEWSRWFRLIDGRTLEGDTLLDAGDDRPVLVLNRAGEGRVALLASDHMWLWARGFEGGGPHTQLLRGLAHWLMKEPELDEESLLADGVGERITIQRQSMRDDLGPVTITEPAGNQVELVLEDKGDGRFEAEWPATSLGLHRVTQGDLTALATVGPENPREYADIVSTSALVQPIADATGGTVRRTARDGTDIPQVVAVRGNGNLHGRNWLGLRDRGASRLTGINHIPLFIGLLGAALLLAAFGAMWWREGR